MPWQSRGLGWRPQLPDARDHLFAAAPHILRALPPSVDLRPQMPPIWDQGALGSCTSHAVLAALAFQMMQQKETPPMFSRLAHYWCERSMEGTTDSDAGAEIRDGFKVIGSQGICPESEWAYDVARFRDKPPASCFTDAAKYRALTYAAVPQDLAQIQAALADNHPVVLGISVYASFMGSDVARSGAVPMPTTSESMEGGHAVCLVGYPDMQTFYARNSWGTGWGMAGYFTIPATYIVSASLCSDLWVVDVAS